MVIGFILIMIVVGTGLVMALYSMYMPFLQDLGDVKFYNTAYYAAVSSLERASLALRYHEPGFEGSGGRKGAQTYGNRSDVIEDQFGFLSLGANGMYRTIDSRVSSIPAKGRGNIEPLFSQESADFNQLGYHMKEKIFLSLDTTTGADQYYTGGAQLQKFGGDTILLQMRINPTMYTGYGDLLGPLNNSDDDLDGDGLRDDEIVSWSWEGEYNNTDPKEFRILPLADVAYYGTSAVVQSEDKMIRESVINDIYPAHSSSGYNIVFDGAKQPIRFPNGTHPARTDTSPQNVISPYADIISGHSFQQIIQDGEYTQSSFTFSLLNFLRNQAGQNYPFLEYAIDTNGYEIADRFYTIRGVGRVGEYEVEVILTKPTSDESIAGDFTVIF